MTLKQFKSLRADVQNYLLMNQAVYIGAMEDVDGDYTLFQLHGFYLEVFCTNADKYKANSMCFFEDSDMLEPYLESISIEPVYAILGYGKFH
jgi:hypothetical protein